MHAHDEPERIDEEALCSCGCLVQIVRQPDGRFTVRAWPCESEQHREAAAQLLRAA